MDCSGTGRGGACPRWCDQPGSLGQGWRGHVPLRPRPSMTVRRRRTSLSGAPGCPSRSLRPAFCTRPLCALEVARSGPGLFPACLCVAHRYGGTFQNVSVKLPITLNKFFQPTEMASQDFFQRWKQLSK